MRVLKDLDIAVIAAVLSATCVGVRAQELARVELDMARTGAMISPLLFGHNLEITRRGAWRGLSAEMAANRKFDKRQGNEATFLKALLLKGMKIAVPEQRVNDAWRARNRSCD